MFRRSKHVFVVRTMYIYDYTHARDPHVPIIIMFGRYAHIIRRAVYSAAFTRTENQARPPVARPRAMITEIHFTV